MAAWRILASVVVVLAAVRAATAQTYRLTETPKAGDCFQVQLQMTLAGEIRVHKDHKPVSLKLAATATHAFPERVLIVGGDGIPQKTARVYETAKAVITIGTDRSERSLRDGRRLIVAQRPTDQLLAYCPAGTLTREELELIGEHFDTLALTGLLPGKAVPIKATWKVSNPVAQALCNFEGLTGQDLSCQLVEVKGNLAYVAVTGSATGIDVGALAKLKISGNYIFDLDRHRLMSLTWKQKDDRDQGPASPASAVESTTTLKRSPIDLPEGLTDLALIPVADKFEVSPDLTQLIYHDPKSRFDVSYGREWQTVGETERHLVLRCMERGDLIAQVTITPWPRAKAGDHLSPETFQDEMANTPGWSQDEVLQTGVVPSPEDQPGRWVYRVSAVGRMDGIKVLQNFYLVAGPGGDQVVLAFTMAQAQAEKLGTRDLSLAGSIDFPPAGKPK
ncbi:MAG TPA: hypothetical protein VG013_35675 [Gemmataceae bacterium]|jgi:hypothetical protein|nr:hypothetical protein [Gemmataceae bacterium]